MGTHVPEPQIVPEGKVVREEDLDNVQVSAHLASYQKQWIEIKKEGEGFNLSGHIRDMVDYMILQDEVDVPESVFMPEEEVERSVLDAYVTE